MSYSALFLITLTVLALAVTRSPAAELYVAAEHPEASDNNPGTEALPWKTLTKAARSAKPGDTVLVKAGTYIEPLEINGQNITFRAFADDRVVLLPQDRIEHIAPATWRKSEGLQNVYECDTVLEGGYKDQVLRVDGKAVAFIITHGPRVEVLTGDAQKRTVQENRRLGDDEVRRWTIDENGRVCLNLGGDDPARHDVHVVTPGPGGIIMKGKGCKVSGFELRYCRPELSGDGNVLEDCLIEKMPNDLQTRHIIVAGRNVIRRCTFRRCGQIDIGTEGVFEENLVTESNRWVPEMHPPQVPPNIMYGVNLWNRALGYHASHYQLVRYNVVTDCCQWGLWNDCMCYGSYIYGNCFARNWSGGVYNEAECHDTRILYNSLQKNGSFGVTTRVANRVFIQYNLIDSNTDYGIGIWSTDIWPMPPSNVVLHNLVTGQPHALQIFAWEKDYSRRRALSCVFDHNIYSVLPGGTFLNDQVKTFAQWQKASRTDVNSRSASDGSMEDFGLGTLTFRVPNSEDPYECLSMVYNPLSRGLLAEPLPGSDLDAPYFWMWGESDALPSPDWERIYQPNWLYAGFCGVFKKMAKFREDAVAGDPLKNGEQPFWLETYTADAKTIPAQGSGWWSRSVPTVPGAKVKVSLRVSGEDLRPVEGQAVLVFVRFSSPTGQHVTKEFVIGGDRDGEILQGTFGWRTFARKMTVPRNAERMAVFFGVRPCTGAARFAEIRISTDPGCRPAAPEIPWNVRYEPIDLRRYCNRDLDANVTGRLIDNGSPGKIDLSYMKKGSTTVAGVPFRVDGALVLKSSMFPQIAGLPSKVEGVPLKGKAAAIYVWFRYVAPVQDREQFRLVVHYDDGTCDEAAFVSQEELAVARRAIGNRVIWGDRLVWVNPRSEASVNSIDIVGADTGEVAILGITAARPS